MAAHDTDRGGGDGTAAVLYGMFTSFTEALAGLEERLAAIEAVLRTEAGRAPGRFDARLAALEEAVDRVAEAVAADPAPALDGAVSETLAALDRRVAALAVGVDGVRSLLEAHVDDAHSLGRRAGEAGRRLVGDLWGRPRRPGDAGS